MTGDGFWSTKECAAIGLSARKVSDGPHGMRVQIKRPSNLGMGGSLPATCFPTASALACSFDEELAAEAGKALGEEAASFGVSMVLGPGLNVKRNPLCGRNFEYFSEDCYLSGKMAAAMVRGIQQNGVTACIKHFAANGREYSRMYYDSRIDEATLRETYLTGFEIAVKEGRAGAVMTAYNKLNGEYCNQNPELLRGVLRGEWGFNGLVVSDWGGSHDAVKAVKAGADLEMPECKFSAGEIVEAVKCGGLDEKQVDESVRRLAAFARGAEKTEKKPFDKAAHSDFAAEVAAQCMVLLKNENGALPLKNGERVAVIGDFAENPRYQGAGSSQVVPTSLDNIKGAIENSGLTFVGYERGFKRKGGKSARLVQRAVKLAVRADTIVLCLGLNEGRECEGCDRSDININENQTYLLRVLAALNRKIVVVLSCGSAVNTDWDADADALLLAHLAGQSGGRAVADVLTGKVNPSGRLAESFPHSLGDVPSQPEYSVSPYKCDHAEGIFVGYKYYGAAGVPVKYPFGFGLSYTDFLYSDFSVGSDGVRFKVKNIGGADGATVAQIYVRAPRKNLAVSPAELKLFKKFYIKAGESVEAFLPYDAYTFRTWNAVSHRFEAGGVYEISLGENAASVLFYGELEINGGNLPEGCFAATDCGAAQTFGEYYNSHITDPMPFEKAKGRVIVTLDTNVRELTHAKGIVGKVFGLIAKISARSKDRVKANILSWVSVRSLMQFMNLNAAQADGFILACNGHFFKGVKKLVFKK